jgi:hypothetical protein
MMQNLFDTRDRKDLARRLASLQPSSARQWGKMDVSQMLAHCAVALEVPCGDRVTPQRLLGRILAPFVRASVLGEKPMARNAPTSPEYRIADSRDFERERARLATLVDRFASLGPTGVDGVVHAFFGRLTGDEWSRLMYKHLDHHLRQFGA